MRPRWSSLLFAALLSSLPLACDGEGDEAAEAAEAAEESEQVEPTVCGELTCDTSEFCVQTPNFPSCSNKDNPDDPCPEGTTDTSCGGAGAPCCCGPTPPPDFECLPRPEDCMGPATCSCVDTAQVCGPEFEWQCSNTSTPNRLLCEYLEA